jgi:hypothetical protein
LLAVPASLRAGSAPRERRKNSGKPKTDFDNEPEFSDPKRDQSKARVRVTFALCTTQFILRPWRGPTGRRTDRS